MPSVARIRARAVDTVRSDVGHVPKWAALDGLRGLAIVVVVAYHATGMLLRSSGAWPTRGWSWWWLGTGRLAVDVLFVLSGFLVVRSWRAARERAPGAVTAARDFFGRRARRILPVYAASLLFALAVLQVRASGRMIALRDLAVFASLQQHLVRGLPETLNLPSWSLTTEVHFYLLVPLLALLVARVRGALVVAACVALTLAYVHGSWKGQLPASTILGRLDQFAVGAVAATVVARWPNRARVLSPLARRGIVPLAFAALVGLGVAEGMVLARRPDHLAAAAVHPAAGIVVAALIVHLCVGRAPAWLSSRPARFLGLISYSAYLLHYPVLQWGLSTDGPLRWGLDRRGPAAATLGTLAVLTVLAVVILAVSVACYLLVERRFIRHRFGRPERSGPPAPQGPGGPSGRPEGSRPDSDDRSPVASGASRLTRTS